jgi:hypothetical protein
MKIQNTVRMLSFLAVVFLAGTQASLAQARDKRVVPQTDSHAETPSETADFGHSSHKRGLGFSSINQLSGADTVVTGVLQLNPADLVQVFAGVPQTRGGFQFTLGGLYKHTIIGTQSAGIHLGGGMAVGSLGAFAFSLAGVGGIHVAFPGVSQLMLHVDGGPRFSFIDNNGAAAGGPSKTDLNLGAFSSILGLSVIYMF